MYDPTNEISTALNGGMSTDMNMLIVYVIVSCVPLICIGLTLYSRFSVDERDNFGPYVLLTTCCLAVFLPGVFFLLPHMRKVDFDLPAARVVQAAQQGHLVAEQRRTLDGNVISDSIILRDSNVENLFGQPVETSTWSKEVSVEQAREIDRILTENRQGYMVWRGQAKDK